MQILSANTASGLPIRHSKWDDKSMHGTGWCSL
jgi:hypothetical protein